MAESFIQYNASGSTDTFSVPFGYLDEDHISVKLDGVNTAFTFPSSSQVQITSGNPTAGTIVEVRRITPRDNREIVWQNAANLTESDLNTSDLQLLYVTQEAFDTAEESIKISSDDTWDAENKRIKNISSPLNPDDAVNKSYVDASTLDIVLDAETARDGAETAESSCQAVLAQMQLLYDDWDDRYLGSKVSDPAVDNDGDPLEDGALYFNTTANQLRVYDLTSGIWLVFEAVIADNSITNNKLTNDSVGTDELIASSVTWEKLGSSLIASVSDMVSGTANKVLSATNFKTYMDSYKPVLQTPVALTDQTAVDFASIPDGVDEIKIFVSNGSLNGTSDVLVQIGTSGGLETSGYVGNVSNDSGGSTSYTTGFQLTENVTAASNVFQISAVLNLVDATNNIWVIDSGYARTDSTFNGESNGTKTLSGTLDRIRITTVNGTDQLDAGTVNIRY